MRIDPWVHSPLLKLALLWVPAAGLLLWLKLRKIQSVIIYFVSMASLFCYLLWLGATMFVGSPSFFRLSSESKDLQIVLGAFGSFTLFAIPVAASVGSFILFIASFIAKPGEHRFLVPANLLTLVLWASSMVAPN
jgi:hypothetical protein